MNFIAETNKHARALENWTKGHGFSDADALQDLANIWNKFKNIPEYRAQIYPDSKSNVVDVDVSCGNCSAVRDMLTLCVNWRVILANVVMVDIPNVPLAEVETVKMSFDVPQTIPQVEVDYSSMKMHQLRSIAKKKGVEYSNKTTKEELIRLING